ncbi:MAG: copper homeostasis protein CutC [Putridiphycobacter sp.]|nr:copper homeostasis protein CutC [Putridiphycobacter sp.]
MTIEICADSYETALIARKYNAKRIELCSALTVGGLTPSYGLMQQCADISDIEVHAMIRHCQGGFVLQNADVSIMLKDIEAAAEAGVNGVVLGCITDSKKVDRQNLKTLVQMAQNNGLEVTFHRAFDLIDQPLEAIDVLVDLGVHRILTSGQKPTAIEGRAIIKEMVAYSAQRIQLMAGSGVSAKNALELAKTGVDALHFTAHKPSDESVEFEMGIRNVPDIQKIEAITALFA